MDILISNLLSKKKLILGSGHTENTQIRVFAYFQFVQFPKSKIDFGQYLKKIKNGFSIVFPKSDVALAGVNCGDRVGVLQGFGPYFIEKSLGTFKILILSLRSFIPHC